MNLHHTPTPRPIWRLALLSAALTGAALLAGCGGSDNAAPTTTPGTSTAPNLSTASASSAGFLAYLASLAAQANAMFDSAEPIDLGGFTLPSNNADTQEPVATAIDASSGA